MGHILSLVAPLITKRDTNFRKGNPGSSKINADVMISRIRGLANVFYLCLSHGEEDGQLHNQ